MPTIRSSAAKNGKGDLAVMSIEAYEQLVGRYELYGLLQEGLSDVAEGKTRPFSEAMVDLRSKRKQGKAPTFHSEEPFLSVYFGTVHYLRSNSR